MKKKIVLPPLTALLEHPVQNIFFALINKIFLQTLVEIILDILFFLGPPTNKMKISHMECWVSK